MEKKKAVLFMGPHSRPKPKLGERCKECAWLLEAHTKEDVLATCASVVKQKTRRKKG